jgi:hypothetical protein
MAIEYTPHDDAVRRSIQMIIRNDPKFTNHAAAISQLGRFLGKPFPFQLPPRVTGDSKAANWDETDKVTYEPVAIWMGAQARKISIEAQYFVTGEKEWSGIEISKLSHAAKAYFYRSIEAAVNESGFGPIVEINSLYGAVMGKSTWRMIDVNVDYAREFVTDDNSGTGNAAGGLSRVGSSAGYTRSNSVWPVWTKITFNLASWTRLQEDDSDEDSAKQPVDSLEPAPTPDWY